MPDQRIYIIKGKKYPSVTTITGILGSIGMLYFYGKHGIQEAKRIGKQAANLGKKQHRALRRDSVGKKCRPKKCGKKLNRMLKQYIRFKIKYKFKSMYSELVVYSKKHNYAGTLDNIGSIYISSAYHPLVMVDWKSSKAIYPEYILQLAAYFFAYKEMHPNTGIKKAWIVRFKKDEKGKVLPEIKKIKYKKLKKAFKTFIHLRKVYAWKGSQT